MKVGLIVRLSTTSLLVGQPRGFSKRPFGQQGSLASLGIAESGNMKALRSFRNLRAASDAGPVSRILYSVAAVTVIPLGRPLLDGSSDLPGSLTPRAETHHGRYRPGSFPIWSCSVWGLPCPAHYCAGGALLPHLFTLIPQSGTVCFLWHFPSNVLEHALPDVIRHTALRSSDFPPSFRAAWVYPSVHGKTATIRSSIAISIIGCRRRVDCGKKSPGRSESYGLLFRAWPV